MCTEAVEWHREAGNVESVPNKDAFPIEGKNGCAMTKNWDVWIVAHPNLKARDNFVGDEWRIVGQHVVRGPGVCHHKATVGRGRGGWKRQFVDEADDLWRCKLGSGSLNFICRSY
jgi:hypothetical protein